MDFASIKKEIKQGHEQWIMLEEKNGGVYYGRADDSAFFIMHYHCAAIFMSAVVVHRNRKMFGRSHTYYEYGGMSFVIEAALTSLGAVVVGTGYSAKDYE